MDNSRLLISHAMKMLDSHWCLFPSLFNIRHVVLGGIICMNYDSSIAYVRCAHMYKWCHHKHPGFRVFYVTSKFCSLTSNSAWLYYNGKPANLTVGRLCHVTHEQCLLLERELLMLKRLLEYFECSAWTWWCSSTCTHVHVSAIIRGFDQGFKRLVFHCWIRRYSKLQ